MSLVPEKRKCEKCGRKYKFAPDSGMIRCPHCYKDDYKKRSIISKSRIK